MSIIEIDGVKCLDLASLKSIPKELLKSPVWKFLSLNFRIIIHIVNLKVEVMDIIKEDNIYVVDLRSIIVN